MEIDYELTPEDFYKFSRENAPTQSPHKPLVVLYLITYLVFIFGDVIYALLTGTLKDWHFGTFLASLAIRSVICFAALFIALGLIKIVANRKMKEALSEPQNGLFCPHRIILNENELIELTDVNTSRYAWKAIGEVKETESYILINVQLSSSYIIPKRFFSDAKESRSFVEAAKQYRQNAEGRFQLSHMIEYEKSLE